MDWHNQRGAVLLQAILVIAIVVALGALAVSSMGKRVAGERSGEVIAAEARELTEIGAAMRRVAQRDGADWPAGEAQTFDVATLQDQGFLPSDFALRETVPGTTAAVSPFLQPYSAVAIKDADGIVRTVVRETGRAAEARVLRVGSTPTADGIANLKDQIAARVIVDGQTPAGIVRAGGMTAYGTLSGFTKDLTAWLGSAPDEPITVVLVGFPDLDGGSGSGPTDPVPPGSTGNYSACNLVQPTLLHAPATCPVDQVQVAMWPMCAPVNPYHTKYVAYPSDVGTMTSGVRETYSPPKIICSPEIGPSCVGSECVGSLCRYNYYDEENYQLHDNLRKDKSISVITSINSGEMVESGCGEVVWGVSGDGGCNYQRPNAPAYTYGALFGTNRFSGPICTLDIPNAVVAAKKEAAMNVLCCTPR